MYIAQNSPHCGENLKSRGPLRGDTYTLSSDDLTKMSVNITAFRNVKQCSFVGRHGTIKYKNSEDH
jgi:hypothetical protein